MCPRYITRISQRDEAGGESLSFLNARAKSFPRRRGLFSSAGHSLLSTCGSRLIKGAPRSRGLLVPPPPLAGGQFHVTTRDNDDDDGVSGAASTSPRRGQTRAARLSDLATPHSTQRVRPRALTFRGGTVPAIILRTAAR